MATPQALRVNNNYWRSTCIGDDVFAKTMRKSAAAVIDGKKALVVCVFFVYLVYIICMGLKHCLRISNNEFH